MEEIIDLNNMSFCDKVKFLSKFSNKELKFALIKKNGSTDLFPCEPFKSDHEKNILIKHIDAKASMISDLFLGKKTKEKLITFILISSGEKQINALRLIGESNRGYGNHWYKFVCKKIREHKELKKEIELIIKSAKNEINGIEINIENQNIDPTIRIKGIKPSPKIISNIINLISQEYNVKPKDVFGKTRKGELIIPRYAIYYVISEIMGYSCTFTSKILNKKSHATISKGLIKAKKLSEEDQKFIKTINKCIDFLKNQVISIDNHNNNIKIST